MTIRTAIKILLAASFMAGTGVMSAVGQEETRQFSAKSGEQVNRTFELAGAEKYEEALANLERLITESSLMAYERSTVYQMMGQYLYELDRPIDAQKAFENAVAAGGLLPKEVESIKIVIAQLMIGNGQFREGAERLETYLNAGGQEKPQYIDLLVNAWIQAEDYPRALPWAEKWAEMSDPKLRKHYDLLNFLYVQLGKQDQQIEILKIMIDRWPEEKTLWDSLASVLASAGQEKEAFEVTKLMYQSGLLKTEDDILTLVKYHKYYDMPYQGAELLEAEIRTGRVSETAENLKYLGSLFRQARVPERAIPILEAAAKLSKGPEINIDLGETLSHAGECRKASTYFERAVQAGYVEGKARMLVGNCYADQVSKSKRLTCNMTDSDVATAPITLARKNAIESFEMIPSSSDYHADAQKWVSFISGDLAAYEGRCRHDYIQPDLCFVKIKRAYDAAIFTDGFKLDDKSCEKYVAKYDAQFRNNRSED